MGELRDESAFDTRAVHAGRADMTDVHAPPLDLSTTYPLHDVESGGAAYEALGAGLGPTPEGGPLYARAWNPTVARFEEGLAALEGTTHAVAFASGMAATTAAVLASRARGGHHVVAIRPLYGGTDHLLGLGFLDVESTYVDPHPDTRVVAKAVSDALRPDTGLIVAETPGNPTLDLIDLDVLVDAAGDVPVMIDNTFATPVLQNPAAHGVRLVMHSATKYLGGHGDVMGGVIATDEDWAATLRQVRIITGSLLHPLGGYLLHRGLPTLPIRVRAQQSGAEQVARWLGDQPQVLEVFYPGVHDPQGLIGRQMRGPGAMLSIRVRGGFEGAATMLSRLKMITHAVSLGGVDTLAQHPAALTHRPVPDDARPTDDLVRFSIGLEDPADIIADIDQALGYS